MRAIIRNLYARLQGRRAQANLDAVVATFESAAASLDVTAAHLFDEHMANLRRIDAISARNASVWASLNRARRVQSKLRGFIA